MLKYTILFIIFMISPIFSNSSYNEELLNFTKITELVEIDSRKMQSSICIPSTTKSILVLGLSGTGKSTLINYLNEVPLVCRLKDEIKWIIDLESINSSLPCGFSIGHSTSSHTDIPSGYNPPGKDFSYIDTPGFKDNRGLEIDIANAFSTNRVTKSVNHLKFLILFDYSDIIDRGKNFLDTIKRFSDLMGIFQDKDMKNLHKSIGVIFTKVKYNNKDDLYIKAYLKDLALKFLNNGLTNGVIRKNDFKIFEKVISNNQMEIGVSRCPKVEQMERNEKMKLDNIQKNQILSMIDRLDYIDKNLLKMHPKIDSSQSGLLVSFLENFYNQLKLNVEKSIDNYIDKLFEIVSKAIFRSDIDMIKNKIEHLTRSENQDLKIFMEKNDNIFDENKRKKILQDKEFFEFFISLLLDKTNFLNRKFVDSSFLTQLNDYNSALEIFYKEIKPNYDTNKGSLVFKDHFVNISQVINYINNNRELINIKNIIIHATHSLIFDTDFKILKETYETNGPNLVIISPNVVLQKQINVDLSCLRVPGFPDGEEKANDGKDFGENGEDGKPGLPGYNGGNLVIISETFNSSYLNFISNGGQGGPGQNGGNGKKGRDGRDASHYNIDIQNKIHLFEEKIIFDDHTSYDIWSKSFTLNGESGLPGGNAGKGGCGGIIGGTGTITIYQLSKNINHLEMNIIYQKYKNNIFQKVSASNNGRSGKVGEGGLMGRLAYREYRGTFADKALRIVSDIFTLGIAEVAHSNDKYEFYKDEFRSQYRIGSVFHPLERSESGLIPNELNKIGQIESTPPLDPLDQIYQIENEHLKFTCQTLLQYQYKKFFNQAFSIDLITKTRLIDSKQSLFDLIERVENLIQFEFNEMHMSLEKELLHYLRRSIFDRHEKSVVNLLLTTLKSTVFYYKSSRETTYVIDIKKYLEITLKQIKNLKQLEDQNIRNIYKTSYEINLKKKIDESNDLIKTLEKDINNSLEQLDRDIKNTIREIQYLKNDIEYEKSSLAIKQEELENALDLKKGLQIAKIATSSLFFAGDFGNKIASFCESSLDSATNLASSNPISKISNYFENLNFEENINNYNNLMKKLGESDYNNNNSSNFKEKTYGTQLEEIDGLIKKSQNNLENLDKVEIHLNQLKQNSKKQIDKNIKELTSSLTNTTSIKLEFKKWNIKNDLGSLRNQLKLLTSNLPGSFLITNTLSRIEHTISTLIDINSHIDQLIQQTDLASYISLITQPDFFSQISHQYTPKINQLKRKIHSIILNQTYTKVIEAFSYWSFPFFNEFKSNLNLSVNIDSNDITTFMAHNLDQLLDLVNKNEIELIPKLDNHIQTLNFDKQNAFFKWTYKENQKEIEKFLNGESASFYSDIKQSHYNAVKFKLIYILIEIDESDSINKKFNDYLGSNHVYVSLTHSGESYYKLLNDDDYYLIKANYYNGNKLMINYDYKCNTDMMMNKPCENSNESFKKLYTKTPFLSPYTYWDIKLNVNEKFSTNRSIFKELNSYIENYEGINIYLCGKGQYVSNQYFEKFSVDNDYFKIKI